MDYITLLTPINQVYPYTRNNKKHPEEQVKKIAASIEAFGWDQPIVTDKKGVIIKGHGRYEAAKLLGLKEVPVITRDDLTAQQVKAARIADNRTAQSDWDLEALIAEIDELSEVGEIDVDLLGFDPHELEDFDSEINLSDSSDSKEDDYEPPEEINTDIKLGDLFEIGPHRLLCGDSADRKQVERLMNGEKADMVFTDPPYGVAYVGKTKDALTIW